MNKNLKSVLLIVAVLVLTFGSGMGQNNFVPSPLWIRFGTILAIIIAATTGLMLLGTMIKQRTPIALETV